MTALTPIRLSDAKAMVNSVVEATPDRGFAKKSIERRISPSIVAGTMRLLEASILVFSGFAVAAAWVGGEDAFADSRYVVAILMTAFAAFLFKQRFDVYSIAALTSPLRQTPKLLLSWTMAMSVLISSVFLMKIGPEFSRGWLLIWFVAGFATLLIGRYAASHVVQTWAREGRLNRRAVIFGAGPEGQALIDAIEADRADEAQICGIFDDRGGDRVATHVRGYPRLGNIDELVQFCRSTPVDLLIVSLPITAEARLLEILKKLWVLPIDIRLAAHSNKLRFRPRAYSFLGNVPLIDLFDKPLADWDSFVKAIFDKSVAALALVLLAPILALVALAVRLDSRGPILFRQKRLGFNNEMVEVFKFRSMYVDLADSGAAKLVSRGDPRVTRVGRFIRRTSLDELPQLFNVLNGTLSLVGPRPHALQAKAAERLYHEVVDGYFARHKVKPGITGWAQVNGWRGETDTSEKILKRVEHDLYYIENWSLFFDIYILARTPLALMKSDNAY